MNFAVSFATHTKINLASIDFKRGQWKVKRLNAAQSLGYHIPASNDRDLVNCADYLAKESAAVSAVCNGYLVTKMP